MKGYERRKALIAALLAGCAFHAGAAHAQAAASQRPPEAAQTRAAADTGIADIVVTAQKRQQTLSDVPMSITALTGSQLLSKGISDVQDLVKVTPGLSYLDSGRGVPVFSLRGVGFFDASIGARPTVSVYIDEAPLPFSIEAKGASFDLERVEILKGPQGTLFGASSTGGAINYIAAKPTSDFQAGFTGSYGRFNTVDLQGYVSGPIAPTINARLAVRTVHGDDWQQNYTRHDTLGAQNFTQARLLVDWKPTDRITVRLNVNGSYDRSDTQAPQFQGVSKPSPVIPLLVSYPTAPANDRAADWDPNSDFRRHNGFIQSSLRVDYDVSEAFKLTSLFSYAHQHIDTFSDADGTALTNINIGVKGKLDSVSEELRASGDVGRLHYLVGGSYAGDITHENDDLFQPYSSSNTPATPLDEPGTLSSQNFKTYAAFADATYKLTDKLRFNAGVRYTKQDLDYNACLYVADQNSANAFTTIINGLRAKPANGSLPPIAPLVVGQCASLDSGINPARIFGTFNESNVSWRAGLDYKPTKRTLLYVTVSKGYKGGSSPATGASSIDEFTPVKQESVLSYEAGIKTALFNRVLEFSAAGFYYDYHDKQLLGRAIFTPNIFGPLQALINVPKSRIVGAEGQITLRPVRALTLSAAGTYLDSKVRSSFSNYDIIGNPIQLKGDRFPYTSKWQLVLDGEWKPPLTETLNGVLGANASYRSSTVAGFGGDPRLDIDSYWLVDLRAGVEARNGRWSAQVYGRNIFNQYYWNNVAAQTNSVRRYAGMPATYGVQVSFKF
jgi:outer membrane receptor protein involved in Fe transport